MVARVTKNHIKGIIRDEMRALRQPGIEPYLQVAVVYLNILFGVSKKSSSYWTFELPTILLGKFGYEYDVVKELSSVDLDTKSWLFRRLQQITGNEIDLSVT